MHLDRRTSFTTIVIGFLISCSFGCAHNSAFDKRLSSPTVCFTPGSDCTGVIVEEIAKARNRILVQAYSFTSITIADALVGTFKRGIKVEAVLDKSQEFDRHSVMAELVDAGIPTYIDRQHAIAHNKVMVIDNATVLTGSFNFTKAAQEKNSENLVVLHDPNLVSAYVKNWKYHRNHSGLYRP